MAAASPTPFPTSSYGYGRSSRISNIRPRRNQSILAPQRANSPPSVLDQSHGFAAGVNGLQRISIGDSSDDDIPVPMHFSALTKALLEDRPAIRERSPVVQQYYSRHQDGSSGMSAQRSRAGTPSRGALRISRKSPSQTEQENNLSPPRVIHLSASKVGSGLRKQASIPGGLAQQAFPREESPRELVTPAPSHRDRPIIGPRTGSFLSEGRTNGLSESENAAYSDALGLSQTRPWHSEYDASQEQGHGSLLDSSTKGMTRPAVEGVPGSLRVKRVPVGSGTFLRGAPMRRGFRRRPSDENQSPSDEPLASPAEGQCYANGIDESINNEVVRSPAPEIAVHDFAQKQDIRESQLPPPGRPPLAEHRRDAFLSANAAIAPLRQHSPPPVPDNDRRAHKAQVEHVFKMPALPPPNPSLHDQENEPPNTFKRTKPGKISVLGASDKHDILGLGNELKSHKIATTNISPPRAALAPRNINTPHRAAPPPPKMTALETVTAVGGASTVKKKKRSHFSINGKMYAARGKIGKGGSSDVYRVMAENDKIFALKRVALEDCNEETVRGYKGEIDLLKALENVDRVVRLFDWEVNEQKQSLSVLMEVGESDLNRILSLRLHPEDAHLDLSFVRHYWREMLECVAAVHAYDIVHSDLKPANFLLVQGRLKLIDFGIAGAIDTDNTVNVHRETNVGTPNYMSPESLQDVNAAERAHGASKLMKLGKASDVWSLGCILYQMTYGKPPFAYIANQFNRVMAIINPAIAISYPTTGVGGTYVPSSLRRLLRQCLNRDATKRITIAQMLSGSEPFLNPDVALDGENGVGGSVPMSEELLGQILMNIVARCKDPKRGCPTDTELRSTYPKAFLEKIRSSLERS